MEFERRRFELSSLDPMQHDSVPVGLVVYCQPGHWTVSSPMNITHSNPRNVLSRHDLHTMQREVIRSKPACTID